MRRADDTVMCPPIEYEPVGASALSELVEVGPGGEIMTWTWNRSPRPQQPFDRLFAWAMVHLDGADTTTPRRDGHTTVESAEPVGSDRAAPRRESGASVRPMGLAIGIDADEVRIGLRVRARWKPDDEIEMSATTILWWEPTGEPDVVVYDFARVGHFDDEARSVRAAP